MIIKIAEYYAPVISSSYYMLDSRELEKTGPNRLCYKHS